MKHIEVFILSQMFSRRSFTLALALLSLPSFAKPQRMRIVVSYPAGGPLDAAARIIAEGLKKEHGRVIVITAQEPQVLAACLKSKMPQLTVRLW